MEICTRAVRSLEDYKRLLEAMALAEPDLRPYYNRNDFYRAMRCRWWLAMHAESPAGICALSIASTIATLEMCVVLPPHRGQGLQRHLIRRRVEAAKAEGCTSVETWTYRSNAVSARNLIACGFEERAGPAGDRARRYWQFAP